MNHTDLSALSANATGVLPAQWLRRAVNEGWIVAHDPIGAGQIQPNSVDLRLSSSCHRVQCSFLPREKSVAALLDQVSWYPAAIPPDGRVLEPDQVYLFRLQEELALPPNVSGRTNPKSSTGRLDIFTRVVTENAVAFDQVPAG